MASVGSREMPRGGARPRRAARPVEPRSLQVHHHHLRGRGAVRPRQPRAVGLHHVLQGGCGGGVLLADQDRVRAQRRPPRLLPRRAVGGQTRPPWRPVDGLGLLGQAADEPQGGERQHVRPRQRHEDWRALRPPRLRRHRDPGERDHSRHDPQDHRRVVDEPQPWNARPHAPLVHRDALRDVRHLLRDAEDGHDQGAAARLHRRGRKPRPPSESRVREEARRDDLEGLGVADDADPSRRRRTADEGGLGAPVRRAAAHPDERLRLRGHGAEAEQGERLHGHVGRRLRARRKILRPRPRAGQARAEPEMREGLRARREVEADLRVLRGERRARRPRLYPRGDEAQG